MTAEGKLQPGDLFCIRSEDGGRSVYLAYLTEEAAIAEKRPVFKCTGDGPGAYVPWNPVAREYLGMEKKP